MTRLATYLLNAAASGQVPTTLADTGPGTAVPMALTYSGAIPAWTSNAAGNGLQWAGNSTGRAAATLAGTKLALVNPVALELTWVLTVTNTTSVFWVGGIGLPSDGEAESSGGLRLVLYDGVIHLQCRRNGPAGFDFQNDGTDFPTGTPFVLTVSINGALATADKFKIWVNKTRVSINFNVAAFTNLIWAGTPYICLGNSPTSGSDELNGTVWYFDVEDTPLSDVARDAKHDALLLNHDTDPAGGGAQTITASGIASGEAVGSAAIARVQIATVGGIASGETFGSMALTRAIQPSGIASGETFGAPRFDFNALLQGIATSELIGALAVVPAPVAITMSEIASAEQVPTPALLGTAILSFTGVASGEAFGAPRLDRNVTLPAIGSGELFGTQIVQLSLALSGITSGEVFGGATITPAAASISLPSIASSETFGLLLVQPSLALIGIGSAESFGTARFDQNLVFTGIGSGEQIGNLSILSQLNLPAIASAEAFGSTTVSPGAIVVAPIGIASSEVVPGGLIQLNVNMPPIASGEAFGAATVARIQFVQLAPVASGETFGSTSVLPTGAFILPSGIGSAETFGVVVIPPPVASLQFSGLPSSESVSNPTLNLNLPFQPIPSAEVVNNLAVVPVGGISLFGIPSGEALGLAMVVPSPVSLAFPSIGTGETFGSTTLSPGAIQILIGGIPTQENFGGSQIQPAAVSLILSAIASSEQFGTPLVQMSMVVGNVLSAEAFGQALLQGDIITQGIPSSMAFGDAMLSGGVLSMALDGIASGEAFGNVALLGEAVSLGFLGIESEETFGSVGFWISVGVPTARVSLKIYMNTRIRLRVKEA